jgi:hypothetical protein
LVHEQNRNNKITIPQSSSVVIQGLTGTKLLKQSQDISPDNALKHDTKAKTEKHPTAAKRVNFGKNPMQCFL